MTSQQGSREPKARSQRCTWQQVNGIGQSVAQDVMALHNLTYTSVTCRL